jgi:hypothetical protein
VIARPNAALDGARSFEVVAHEVRDDEVLVLGKLTAAGLVKMQFGASQVTRDRESVVSWRSLNAWACGGVSMPGGRLTLAGRSNRLLPRFPGQAPPAGGTLRACCRRLPTRRPPTGS